MAANSYSYIISNFQVEVIVDDNSRETPKDNVLSRFTIEASLYDTNGWYKSGANTDLISSNVSIMKLNVSSSPRLGFHGYFLGGRLDKPKLWSAEQVRKPGPLDFSTLSPSCYLFLIRV